MNRIHTTRGARAPWLAAAGLAALALAAPAAAATRPAPRTAPAPTPTAAPAATAPALQRAAPAARAAPAPAASPAPARGPALFGVAVGATQAFGPGRSVLLRLDYAVLRTPPSWQRFPKLALEAHLVAGFSRPVGEKTLTAQVVPPFGTAPIAVNGGKEEVTALLFEVVPTARALWTPTQGVSFFGDAGLGLVQTFESYDKSEMYVGHTTRREYATGVVLRLGAGLALDVAPRWRVLFEPLAFDLMVGPKFSAWTPTLGVAFRL